MNQPVFEQPAVQTAARESAAYMSARYAQYVVALLMLAFVFSFIDRQILNLLVGRIQRDLHVSSNAFQFASQAVSEPAGTAVPRNGHGSGDFTGREPPG